MRIGQGFDLHRLEPAAPGGVALGGIFVSCDYRVIAHSDGDVVVHALCDALLGALAEGDIGQHFSDADPRWKGVDSAHFLAEVMKIVQRRGYRVVNVDCTVLAEVPKVAPHAKAMRVTLASHLGVTPDAVSVKATTMEKLGDIGRREAIAAQVVALLVRAEA